MQEQGISAHENDNVSQVSSPTLHAGQVREVAQASLDNISDTTTRRQTICVFFTNCTRLCQPKADCHFNLSSLRQLPNSLFLLVEPNSILIPTHVALMMLLRSYHTLGNLYKYRLIPLSLKSFRIFLSSQQQSPVMMLLLERPMWVLLIKHYILVNTWIIFY